MSFTGQDVIDIGSSRIGQKYVFGAEVPLDNPAWRGPWDCAEFTSWCAYQAYDGLIFGGGTVVDVARAEPYSGHWVADAKRRGRVIPWRTALGIPGAALIRAPTTGRTGHVAFALGDDARTLEARGAEYGVGIFDAADSRPWDLGCLLPGVDYDHIGLAASPPAATPRTAALETGHLWLRRPNFKGPEIIAVQRALLSNGLDPGPLDGSFGPMTSAALTAFQLTRGIAVDGLFGRDTARLLALDFPVVATALDKQLYAAVLAPPLPAIALPEATPGIDVVVDIAPDGTAFRATTAAGFRFIIGVGTPFTDDMHRYGLHHKGPSYTDSLKFGVYKATEFFAQFGAWAHFIEPTLGAEGAMRFAALNTYDRAAFTFGAPQLAAHTPNANFILYLRKLLALPGANAHFPELSLRPGAGGKPSVHLRKADGFQDLEVAVEVLRPNGKKEMQLVHLMAFLNPSPTQVDAAEVSAAARLMNWQRTDPLARQLQIEVFIAGVKAGLARAKTKIDGFDGKDWIVALWIMDILHQGRGNYAQMTQALAAADAKDALRRIGLPQHRRRIDTVTAAVAVLSASGVMNGFTV
jgi:Putative peptidoglycan binding domain